MIKKSKNQIINKVFYNYNYLKINILKIKTKKIIKKINMIIQILIANLKVQILIKVYILLIIKKKIINFKIKMKLIKKIKMMIQFKI